MAENTELEVHPWGAFVPREAKYLIMGTFPPARVRWSMDFFYPNVQNDFWRVMGLIFLGDKNALYMPEERRFDLDAIKALLVREGIALSDTGHEVRRLKGNASDKFLEIVTPVDLHALLERMPACHTIATTGEKAAGVIAELTGTPAPRMGEKVEADGLTIWRMPSTSRAYPMSVEKKAEYYRRLFNR